MSIKMNSSCPEHLPGVNFQTLVNEKKTAMTALSQVLYGYFSFRRMEVTLFKIVRT